MKRFFSSPRGTLSKTARNLGLTNVDKSVDAPTAAVPAMTCELSKPVAEVGHFPLVSQLQLGRFPLHPGQPAFAASLHGAKHIIKRHRTPKETLLNVGIVPMQTQRTAPRSARVAHTNRLYVKRFVANLKGGDHFPERAHRPPNWIRNLRPLPEDSTAPPLPR